MFDSKKNASNEIELIRAGAVLAVGGIMAYWWFFEELMNTLKIGYPYIIGVLVFILIREVKDDKEKDRIEADGMEEYSSQ